MSGFVSPNHTQVPNDLFDSLLADMNVGELKVILHAIRQTLGYHRPTDAISITQFMAATGLSRRGVQNGIRDAKARGLLREVSRGKRGLIYYQLVIADADTTVLPSSTVQKVHRSTKYHSTVLLSSTDDASTMLLSSNTKERSTKERKESSSESIAALSNLDTQAYEKRQDYYHAFEAGFPATAPTKLIDSKANQNHARDLFLAHYTPEEITSLVKEKIAAGKANYRFHYLMQDLAQARLERKPTQSSAPPVHHAPDELRRQYEEVLNGR